MVWLHEYSKRSPPIASSITSVILMCSAFLNTVDSANAQETYRHLNVAVIHVSEIERDEGIENVLNKASLMWVERSGFSGFIPDSRTITPQDIREKNIKQLEDILSEEIEGEKKTADLILIGLYQFKQDALQLEYHCIEVKPEEFVLLGSRRKAVQVDLHLDRSISTLINELFETVSDDITRIAETKSRIKEEMKAEKPVVEEEAEPGPEPRIAEHDYPAPEREPKKPLFAVFGSTGVIFFVGNAAAHFPLGVYAKSSIVFPFFETDNTEFSMGVFGGYMRFLPSEPEKAAYIRSSIPFGITARYVIGREHTFTWYISAAGGGTYRIDKEEIVSQYLASVVPYLKIGGGMKLIPLGRRIELNFQVFYLSVINLYREGGGELSIDVISGFSPGINVRVWG